MRYVYLDRGDGGLAGEKGIGNAENREIIKVEITRLSFAPCLRTVCWLGARSRKNRTNHVGSGTVKKFDFLKFGERGVLQGADDGGHIRFAHGSFVGSRRYRIFHFLSDARRTKFCVKMPPESEFDADHAWF